MKSSLTADRVNYDRRRMTLTENLNRGVDLFDVNEAARTDLQELKRVVVQVTREIIVHTCHQVRPMCRRHFPLRRGRRSEEVLNEATAAECRGDVTHKTNFGPD